MHEREQLPPLTFMRHQLQVRTAFALGGNSLQILRAEGAADLMRKYDVNNDGVLDKEEMHEIVRELAEKEAELQDEIDEQAYPGGDADPSKGARPRPAPASHLATGAQTFSCYPMVRREPGGSVVHRSLLQSSNKVFVE